MAGSRTLRRVLGETNLERKCRRIFGTVMLLLIFTAFFGVYWIAKDLAQRIMFSKGKERVRVVLFDYHWERWFTEPEQKPLRTELSKKLLGEDYGGRFYTLGEPYAGTFQPENPEEQAILSRLKTKQEQQLAEIARQIKEQKNLVVNESLDTPLPLKKGQAIDPKDFAATDKALFEFRAAPGEGNYYYYQPVYWQSVCATCHVYDKFLLSPSTKAATSEELPFRAVRVTLPYEETQSSIRWIQAVLWSVGILTVFLAMVALWVVVRYVVVKPLTHLRDVSEGVAKGDLEQRAVINTSDEFEELAASFNKMLRNLIEAQGALRQVNTDLDAKVDQLAQLNMRLHEMNQLKGDFLTNMSHELRTPLNSVLGFSEVLQGADSLNDKQKRYVHNIQKAGRDLLDMINDILDVAKMEAGKMDVRLSEFKIESIIQAQVDMMRPLSEEKNIDLRFEIESDLPLMFQDQQKVQRILTNLLSNAIKFTPEGGRITVGARGTPRGMIEMWVSDTGVGIAGADRDIIFEKFRQGSAITGKDEGNLTREYTGTGLGLSIVKELCKLLGGEVNVESELGKGSTFRILLPWMRADISQTAARMSHKLDDLTKPRRGDFQPGDIAATP
ncbi:MAG: HAMP domain-containing histidine kinase [Pirellulaceae bacterium]|nr:HAMP domain-containing histidine kinase [Pirellulaceae bacterium]